MPKRGQQQIDTPGRNDPGKSQEITTGTYKKQDTYQEQAAVGQDPGKTPQRAKVPEPSGHEGRTAHADSEVRARLGRSRSGSESNAHRGRKHRDAHSSALPDQPGPHPDASEVAAYDHDLHPRSMSADKQSTRNASEIKVLHELLADFTGDELRQLVLVPDGSPLAQGASYLDLHDRQHGPFVATADMTAKEGSYLVAKKNIDYDLWNRLIGITDPARLRDANPSS